MRLLDLFCGAGGAAMGYSQAGFDEIVGIDVEPQPNYPFDFIQANALNPPVELDAFDLVHASPPCQAYSVQRRSDDHPDLVAMTRAVINNGPYVIENVIGAPIRRDVILCGSMFGLQIQRHRAFEFRGLSMLTPACNHHDWPDDRPFTVTGHGDGPNAKPRPHSKGYRDTEHGRELLEVPWMQTRHEIVEAVPPAYTRFIGEQFLAQAKGRPEAT